MHFRCNCEVCDLFLWPRISLSKILRPNLWGSNASEKTKESTRYIHLRLVSVLSNRDTRWYSRDRILKTHLRRIRFLSKLISSLFVDHRSTTISRIEPTRLSFIFLFWSLILCFFHYFDLAPLPYIDPPRKFANSPAWRALCEAIEAPDLVQTCAPASADIISPLEAESLEKAFPSDPSTEGSTAAAPMSPAAQHRRMLACSLFRFMPSLSILLTACIFPKQVSLRRWSNLWVSLCAHC